MQPLSPRPRSLPALGLAAAASLAAACGGPRARHDAAPEPRAAPGDAAPPPTAPVSAADDRCTAPGRSRPVPALVPGARVTAVDAAWTVEPDPACPSGTRDVLAITVRGTPMIGALVDQLVIGDICPAHTPLALGVGDEIVVHLPTLTPADGAVVAYHYGNPGGTCARHDEAWPGPP